MVETQDKTRQETYADGYERSHLCASDAAAHEILSAGIIHSRGAGRVAGWLSVRTSKLYCVPNHTNAGISSWQRPKQICRHIGGARAIFTLGFGVRFTWQSSAQGRYGVSVHHRPATSTRTRKQLDRQLHGVTQVECLKINPTFPQVPSTRTTIYRKMTGVRSQ